MRTNPTISAEEEMAELLLVMRISRYRTKQALDILRQAEQAAYERAAQYHDDKAAECDARGTETVSAALHRRDAIAIRALAQQLVQEVFRAPRAAHDQGHVQ